MVMVVRLGGGPRDCERESRMNDPCAWLTSHLSLLPAGGDSLDVACGSGRHAIWLAEQGFRTRAVDRDVAVIEALKQEADRRGLAIQTQVADLELGEPVFETRSFDVIVV